MSRDHPQVSNLLEALTDKVHKFDERLSAQNVGKVLDLYLFIYDLLTLFVEPVLETFHLYTFHLSPVLWNS